MLRGRSKDRPRKVTPPGPVYMSNGEFADYLKDLRNNRVARPTGARPQPVNTRRDSDKGVVTPPVTDVQPERSSSDFPRSTSVQSHRRAQSSLSNYSSVTSRTGRQLVQQPQSSHTEFVKPLKASDVVPTATYMERGQRWMEKEEAVSLRDALKDMDLKKQEEEESRIHAAAQNEASELVYQHQNPEIVPDPGAPYSYRDHLRKNSYQHARSASIGRHSGAGITTGLARDMGARSVSGGSNVSTDAQSQRGRMSLDSCDTSRHHDPQGYDQEHNSRPNGKSYGSITNSVRPRGSRRRSSAKRNVSGESAGTFLGEQIWEEPEQETGRGRPAGGDKDTPAPLRTKARNPLNRVQFAPENGARSSSTPPEATKNLSLFEIHKNPPTQSRNPTYTANVSSPVKEASSGPDAEKKEIQVPMKDGLEVRSDEIRQATSMFLKDRSPKLPTPTAVSDRPGRPIVSFDSDWKPKEADEKPEVRRRSPFDRYHTNGQTQSLPTRPAAKDVATFVPISNTPDSASIQVKSAPLTQVQDINLPESRPSVPMINLPKSAPVVPTINFLESHPPVPTNNIPSSNPSLPTINLPDSNFSLPTINFPDSAPSIPTIDLPKSSPALPTINLPDAPSISVSAPADTRRPLPNPKTATSRSTQRPVSIPRGHWSPAGKRATATCHQCQLPIEGRVVKLGGSPENFHPQCFICFSCGTGLESLEIRPEPEASRRERLDRIKRRAQGEQLPEVEGQTYAEDGDPRLRFYCHLDWHENFAPRCKHCTTPIMEEHMIALGQHWHYGHFFCAECGDPFQKGQSHIEKDGYAWCIGCQTKRTERRAPKCKKCRQPVIGEYVQALGGEWHDKCFRCATCHGGFDDGAFFPKAVGTETVVLCTRCIERELKA